MEPAAEFVHCHAQLARTVSKMLELARSRDWSGLPALDERCTAIVDRLRTMEHTELAPMDRARLAALMTRIRSEQHELQELVRPQCERLMRKISQLQRQQKLHGAYGGGVRTGWR